MLFKKAKFILLKSVYFHFKVKNKEILIFSQTRLWESLTWQKFSANGSPTLSYNTSYYHKKDFSQSLP